MKEEGTYRDKWSILISFAVGGLVGAGVALLLAPRSGKELRTGIEGLATETREKIAATIEKGRGLYEGGAAAVKHGVEAGKTAYLTDMEKLRKAVGAHVSGVPRETLEKVPDIDIGIIGEPEYTILDLLNNNNLENLSEVAGIVWRNGKEIVVTKRRPWIEDLDRLPQPAWDLFPLEKYVLPFTHERYLMVETSRGCPFACDFWWPR